MSTMREYIDIIDKKKTLCEATSEKMEIIKKERRDGISRFDCHTTGKGYVYIPEICKPYVYSASGVYEDGIVFSDSFKNEKKARVDWQGKSNSEIRSEVKEKLLQIHKDAIKGL